MLRPIKKIKFHVYTEKSYKKKIDLVQVVNNYMRNLVIWVF